MEDNFFIVFLLHPEDEVVRKVSKFHFPLSDLFFKFFSKKKCRSRSPDLSAEVFGIVVAFFNSRVFSFPDEILIPLLFFLFFPPFFANLCPVLVCRTF